MSSRKRPPVFHVRIEGLPKMIQPPARDLPATRPMPAPSNLTRAPHLTTESMPALLNQHETQTIERLLDACTEYERTGDGHLSDIVDKIGMKMMQHFVTRPRTKRPPEPDTTGNEDA